MNNAKLTWKCEQFKITKYNTQEEYDNNKPSSVEKYKGNVITFNGLNAIINILSGKSESDGWYPLNETNTFIGIGNSMSTVSQDDLGLTTHSGTCAYAQADKIEILPDTNQLVITATFGNGSDSNHPKADFAWQEWGIFNGNPSNPINGRTNPNYDSDDPGIAGEDYNIIMFNHKVENMGTKVASATWVVEVTITFVNKS